MRLYDLGADVQRKLVSKDSKKDSIPKLQEGEQFISREEMTIDRFKDFKV